MKRSVGTPRAAGFTLIEVAVALSILGWVMGSALYLVQQYADERVRLREQFYSAQVSWNHLVERYQDAEKWTARSIKSKRPIKGIDTQGDYDWRWSWKSKRRWAMISIATKSRLGCLTASAIGLRCLSIWLSKTDG